VADLDKEADPTEADTRTPVCDLLRDGFGFVPPDLTQEFEIKTSRADFALKTKGNVLAFVEVKRIKLTLNDGHLDQVEKYARKYGADWTILTNGRHWQLHHVDAGSPATTTLVYELDLLDGRRVATQVNELLPMTREGLLHGLAQDAWRSRYAVSAPALRAVLLSDRVIGSAVTELWKVARYRATPTELKAAVAAVLPG
jgi:hypothetical protein